jgi:predicted acyltransferase
MVNENSVSRLQCIDIFRGITIAFMLVVNNPGNPVSIHPQLKHAPWHGVTLADLVFPFFIFIMGAVIPLSIRGRLEKGTKLRSILFRVISRSSLLFILGLVLNGFPMFDLSRIRIPGVLQRIAVVYLFSSLCYLLFRRMLKKDVWQISAHILTSFFILILYYLLLKYIHVPGFGRGILELQGNLVQSIDLKFLQGHLYKSNWDPEGILSTLPAVASGLTGVIAGMILIIPDRKDLVRLGMLIGGGLLLLFLATLTNGIFPYNKNLWSSSYVLLTSSLGILLLGILFLISDILKTGQILLPFKVLGASAIFVYFASELIRKSLWLIPVKDSLTGSTLTLKMWILSRFISPWAHGLDSVYFSVIYVLFWIGIMAFLYSKKIYIRL